MEIITRCPRCKVETPWKNNQGLPAHAGGVLCAFRAPSVSYIPVRAMTDRAVRKLVEDRVTQEISRAVNAWLYTQEHGV